MIDQIIDFNKSFVTQKGYDDYQAEITIKEGIVRGEMPRRALRLVFEWLDLHRDELLENWERLSNSEAAKKIAPLE